MPVHSSNSGPLARLGMVLLLTAAPACVQRVADGRRVADTVSASDSIVKVDTGAVAAGQPAVAPPVVTAPATAPTTARDTTTASPEQPFASPPPTPQTSSTAGSSQPAATPRAAGITAGTAPTASAAVGTNTTQSDIAQLIQHHPIVPISGIPAEKLPDTFNETRGGTRRHEALDILAPRGTPVHSADDGTVIKLFTSKAGGLAVYVTGPAQRFIYYYAHLNAYVNGLTEGQAIHKGDVLGYVGSTGNADPNVPHLHFAIAHTDNIKEWWKGEPIDPATVLQAAARTPIQ